MATASDLKHAAETRRLGYLMRLYSADDVIDWADETIAALEGPAPEWLRDISENRRTNRRKDWGGIAEPPSLLDVALARAPGEVDVARVLAFLFDTLLDLVRRGDRPDVEAVSCLYGVISRVELPSDVAMEIDMLDDQLHLARGGAVTNERLHQDLVDFLTRHAARGA